ncbi:MAG: hypothetical protein HYU41_17190 [Candidatus Rokubacteria bacterium]|nr:hypothetical protein [Candidatus Rokubacteria bacterium]
MSGPPARSLKEIAAASSFLPSFVPMLVLLPALDRVRALRWTQAVMKGMAP